MNKEFSQFLNDNGFNLSIIGPIYGSAVEGEPATYQWKAFLRQHSGNLVPFKRSLDDKIAQHDRCGYGSTPDVALYALMVGGVGCHYYSEARKCYVAAPDLSIYSRGNFLSLALEGHLYAMGIADDKRLHVAASLALTRLYGTAQAIMSGIDKELADIGKPVLTMEERGVLSGIVERMGGTDAGDLLADAIGVSAGVLSQALTAMEYRDDGSRRVAHDDRN